MSHDTLIHRLVRPAVRAVAPSGITPNTVTTLRIGTGMAAAAAFACAPPWPAIGAAVMLLSLALDRADGELARQTNQMSAGGHRYDLFSDGFSNIIAFLGLGIGQWDSLGWAGPALGALAGAGIGTLFWQLNVAGLASVQAWRPAPGIAVDPDDLMVLVPVLVWLGLTTPMLVAAAIITPALALGLGVLGRRRASGGQREC